MKLKNTFLLVILAIAFIACNNDDDNNSVPHDPVKQAVIDNEKLVKYLQTHHYIAPQNGEPFGVIDTIMADDNVTSLYDDSRLKTQDIKENDIDYKLYYIKFNDGVTINPTKADSVLVNYRGFTLDSVKFDERINYTWLSLTNVIRGWQYGFEHFKGGVNVSQAGEPLKFEDTGDGVLFIPSGLAYANTGSGSIPANAPILFFIRLGLVEKADHDNDLILSINEDINGDGNVNNDDSDNDRAPNYLDPDDENDGVLTKDEDIDGDGNPLNDDTDGDGIPNYLDDDDDGDGRLTRDESKTEDRDNDGIVDYLDPDTK